MPEWTERDSTDYRELAPICVPRGAEITSTLLALAPFDVLASFRAIELGCGDGRFAEALLERFPGATLLACDGSESMREAARQRTARFGGRITVRAFDLAALDWWDLMHGADFVVSSWSLHHLADAKKQYLYKAVAERVSLRGALLIADLIEPASAPARRLAADEWDRIAREQAEALERPDLLSRFLDARWNSYRFPDEADHPSALFHQLVWLKHAGFGAVDCFWICAGHAVFGGFK